jgi:hypothetical protein
MGGLNHARVWIGYHERVAMTRAQVKQWIEGFEAAAEVDRAALQAEGPRPQWSISAALSLIEQARQWTEFSRPDPRREEDVERIRLVWAKLHERGGG